MTDFSLDPNDYNVFILNAGYAEDSVVGALIVSRSYDLDLPKQKTWQEAWELSVESLSAMWVHCVSVKFKIPVPGEEKALIPKLCCTLAAGREKRPNFCDECGNSLRLPEAFPSDSEGRKSLSTLFMLNDVLDGSTLDSFYDYWEIAQRHGWDIPGSFYQPGIITVIQDSAEEFLVNFKDAGLRKTWWEKKTDFWSEEKLRIYRVLGG